jgi:hypothetical protein
MALGYRAILRLDAKENAVIVAEKQVRSWLDEKGKRNRTPRAFSDWEGQGHFEFNDQTSLTVVRIEDPRDGSTRQLLRFRESNPSGSWVVTVVACSLPNARREQQSLMVELSKDGASIEEALTEAKPPRLVTHLLESVSVHDSETVLTSAPRIVRVEDIEETIAAILDVGRLASVVIAMPPGGVPDDKWQNVVAQLTNDSRGVSTAFVIAEAAIEEFERRLPSSHAIPRGSIRTFAPRVNLDNPDDGVRHRILGARTFARSINRGKVRGPILIIHAQRARRRLVEAELPLELRRAQDLLRREEVGVVRDSRVDSRAETSMSSASSAPLIRVEKVIPDAGRAAVDWLRARIGPLVKRWLALDVVDEEAIDSLDKFIATTEGGYTVAREQIDLLLVDQNQLQVEIEQLREQLDEAELAAAIESDEARKATREARVLRGRLRDAHKFEDIVVGPEESIWEAPSDVEEFLLRLDPRVSDSPVVKYVVFTGSESAAMEVMKRDQLGRVVGKLWEFSLVLHDYAELRATDGYQGSVHQYLNDPEVNARKCSPQRHAAGESTTVTSNVKMARERVFPVPKSVDPSGQVMMLSHFKPNTSDTFAPRMYYYDDTAASGKIYIGYIGRHLTNSKTN